MARQREEGNDGASVVIHRTLNRIILLAIPAQFYTAGLVVFGVAGFQPHRVLGSVLILVGLLSLIAAAIAGRRRARPMAALGVFVLLFLQPVLAFATRQAAPAVSALHAVTGLFVFVLAQVIERHRPSSSAAPAPAVIATALPTP